METSILTMAAVLLTSGVFAGNDRQARNIDINAPVQCSKLVTIDADSKRVWTVLTNIDNWASWQTDITEPSLHGDLKPETTFDWKSGGARIHSSLHTVEQYSQFGWTGKTFGIFAIHNWKLIEQDGKTIVQVEESMEGLLASVLKKSFNKTLDKGLQKWLDLLKQECENTAG